MTFKLLDNAYAVVTKSWSVRLIAIAGVAEYALNYLPFVTDYIDGVFPALTDYQPAITIGLLVLAAGARVVAQKGLSLPEEAQP